jgi:hypothetical protein
MVRCPVGDVSRVRLWLSQWNSSGEMATSLVRVVGEKRASLVRRVMRCRTI